MEVIEQGTEIVHEMEALSCCWPPGTMNWSAPEPE